MFIRYLHIEDIHKINKEFYFSGSEWRTGPSRYQRLSERHFIDQNLAWAIIGCKQSVVMALETTR